MGKKTRDFFFVKFCLQYLEAGDEGDDDSLLRAQLEVLEVYLLPTRQKNIKITA